MFSSFLSIFAYFRVENLSDQVKCCKKGVTRQNTNLSKKCCEKGAVLRKGGVAKRATSGVVRIKGPTEDLSSTGEKSRFQILRRNLHII